MAIWGELRRRVPVLPVTSASASLSQFSAPRSLYLSPAFAAGSPNYAFAAGPARRPYCYRVTIRLSPLKPHCTAHRRDRFPPADHLRAGEAFIASPLALLRLCP